MKQQNTLILKPAVQGTLDSLCGIYSVVNMLYWLYGPRIKRLTLFRALVHHLHEHHDIAECLTNGMDTPVVDCMLNFLQSSRYRRYPITVHRPFIRKPVRTAHSILMQCQQWLSERPGRVVLLSDQYHWSVLIRMDSNWLYFFDSSTHRRIRRQRWSLGEEAGTHQLFCDAIYFIAREEPHDDGR